MSIGLNMSKNNSKAKKKIYIYDTTLRDGAQREGISFMVIDKLKITEALDTLGVDYIEGGWPLSNLKDEEYFREVKKLNLNHSIITSFGSTRKKDVRPENDENILSLLRAETKAVCLFGKSWDLHVRLALKTALDENLRMISDSISFLKEKDREVIFDAEHFFDGFKKNPRYALKTLQIAIDSGADWIVLCDTNGGSLPTDIKEIFEKVIEFLKPYPHVRLGIHSHNDSDCAVANSIVAVESGATMVHGTINGYGERCGNANLCSVIPGLQIKIGYHCLSKSQLMLLSETSHFVAEIANLTPISWQPYVGSAAFAHKGGIHVSAVKESTSTYEHIDPGLVGNIRRIIVSELSGKSTIILKARELGLDLDKNPEKVTQILRKVKKLEHAGYHFEAADGSFELLLRKEIGLYRRFFDLESYRVIIERREDGSLVTEATIKIRVGDRRIIATEEGNGPVNALDRALRLALGKAFPELKKIELADYKVRVLQEKQGTASIVRVLIETTDGEKIWGTIGVSPNIIEASWEALIDSLEYGLIHAGVDSK